MLLFCLKKAENNDNLKKPLRNDARRFWEHQRCHSLAGASLRALSFSNPLCFPLPLSWGISSSCSTYLLEFLRYLWINLHSKKPCVPLCQCKYALGIS